MPAVTAAGLQRRVERRVDRGHRGCAGRPPRRRSSPGCRRRVAAAAAGSVGAVGVALSLVHATASPPTTSTTAAPSRRCVGAASAARLDPGQVGRPTGGATLGFRGQTATGPVLHAVAHGGPPAECAGNAGRSLIDPSPLVADLAPSGRRNVATAEGHQAERDERDRDATSVTRGTASTVPPGSRAVRERRDVHHRLVEREQRPDHAEHHEHGQGGPAQPGQPGAQPEASHRDAGQHPGRRQLRPARRRAPGRPGPASPHPQRVGEAGAEADDAASARRCRPSATSDVAEHPAGPGDAGGQQRLGPQRRLLAAQPQRGLDAVGRRDDADECRASRPGTRRSAPCSPPSLVMNSCACALVEEAADGWSRCCPARSESRTKPTAQPRSDAALQPPRQGQRTAQAGRGGGRTGAVRQQSGAEVAPRHQRVRDGDHDDREADR